MNDRELPEQVEVVGYHCRDVNGLETLNWLPNENPIPLMTVAQHERIMAAQPGSAKGGEHD